MSDWIVIENSVTKHKNVEFLKRIIYSWFKQKHVLQLLLFLPYFTLNLHAQSRKFMERICYTRSLL